MNKLTERQKRFADYYIETGNGAEAAKKAGYKGKNLNKIASENLTKLDIKSYIDKKLKEKDENRIASQDEVLQYLTKVMRNEEKEKVIVSVQQGETYEIVENDVAAKTRVDAAKELAKRYAACDPSYKLKLEKLQIEKAKLLLEIEKAKGNTGNNGLADIMSEKMKKRINKDE